MFGHAVVHEQEVQEGTKHTPLRGPSVENQHRKVLTTWGRPVRNSRIQLLRDLFSPWVLSLVMSFVATMVLNAEL